jgi:hypothetical protein
VFAASYLWPASSVLTIDYRRFVDKCRLAVLLPERPRKDLLDLLASYEIAVIVPKGGDFVTL